jgi:hypothetical protein
MPARARGQRFETAPIEKPALIRPLEKTTDVA